MEKDSALVVILRSLCFLVAMETGLSADRRKRDLSCIPHSSSRLAVHNVERVGTSKPEGDVETITTNSFTTVFQVGS